MCTLDVAREVALDSIATDASIRGRGGDIIWRGNCVSGEEWTLFGLAFVPAQAEAEAAGSSRESFVMHQHGLLEHHTLEQASWPLAAGRSLAWPIPMYSTDLQCRATSLG